MIIIGLSLLAVIASSYFTFKVFPLKNKDGEKCFPREREQDEKKNGEDEK